MGKKRLELVIWRDANFHKDGVIGGDYLMKTVGWVDVKGKWVRIRGEKSPKGDGYRAVTRVPVANVVKRKKL
jgi:hypothetical protein